jgi:hypothetical protein
LNRPWPIIAYGKVFASGARNQCGDTGGQRHRIRPRRLFCSRDIGRIWRVAEAFEYGIVGIDQGIISTEIASFGGMK